MTSIFFLQYIIKSLLDSVFVISRIIYDVKFSKYYFSKYCLFLISLDFNECKLNNAGCEHVCNNTAGSFNCDCRAGFKLKADKMGCEGNNKYILSKHYVCCYYWNVDFIHVSKHYLYFTLSFYHSARYCCYAF